MGGTIAALAEHAGHEVTIVARGEQRDAIVAHGLSLAGAFGQMTGHPRVIDSITLSDRFDLVVVAVKAHQTTAAVAPHELHGDTPILVVQNGFGGFDAVRERFPENPAAIGLALFGATIAEPGRIHVTYAASLVVGGDRSAVNMTRSILSTQLRVRLTRNPAGAAWTKVLINSVNAMPALTGLSVQRTIAHRGLRRIVTALMREVAQVGYARGEKFADLGAVSARDVRFVSLVPLRWGQIIPLRLAQKMGVVPNYASTLHSIKRGRTTEVDHLSGAVVDAAAEISRTAPINAAVTELIRDVARTGQFLTPDEVIERIALR